jgi:tetratricopeptide (TPR) repeat protein
MKRRILSTALAVFAAVAASAPLAAETSALPWIEDDYARALADARAKQRPIFAEAWAPWCHTCRSMRAFVFTDKALAKDASRFVWLSIDTEKKQNAAFTEKYPVKVWPSFYVIDPKSEKIVMRWVGGATVGQLEKLFAQAANAGTGSRKGAAETLARADALYGAGRYAEAAPVYREALAKMPVSAPDYSRAVDALLWSLYTTKQKKECALFALQALDKLRTGPSAANLAGNGLDCALEIPEGDAARAETVAALEAEARALIANSRVPMAADDRSALYASVMNAREDAKDAEGQSKVAREWVAYLDAEAAKATTPEQLTALDPNRLNAFEAAEQIERAIPMLEKSALAFPDDYNPPARLAYVYLKLKRYDEALAANDAALGKVYGPRKIRVWLVRADIYKAKGDVPAARRTLEEAMAYDETLPASQRSENLTAAVKTKLDGLPVQSAGS